MKQVILTLKVNEHYYIITTQIQKPLETNQSFTMSGLVMRKNKT
jgi:hypothetical protein